MGLKEAFMNVVTLGASGRVENAISSYEYAERLYNEVLEEHTEKHETLTDVLEEAIEAKKNSIKLLKKSSKIFKEINIIDRQELEEHYDIKPDDYRIEEIMENISVLEVLNNYKKSIDYVNYILMGKDGLNIASSGIEMSKIAAVVNNTVNFLGVSKTLGAAGVSAITSSTASTAIVGGSAIGAAGLATGGVAASALTTTAFATGTAAAASTIFAPVVLLAAGAFNHLSANKKIKEIREKENEIYAVINELRENILKFDLYLKRCEEIISGLEKCGEAMMAIFASTKKKLYPFGILSKFKRKLMIRKDKPNYSEAEYELFHRLRIDIGSVLRIVDSPILDFDDIADSAKKIEFEQE